MAFSFKKIQKSIARPFRQLGQGNVGGAGLSLLNLGTFGASGLAQQTIQDIARGPTFPEIPPPRQPPPPVIAQARPPLRNIPEADTAEATTRALFRNRGRRTTLLTPGRGAGARSTDRLGMTGRG